MTDSLTKEGQIEARAALARTIAAKYGRPDQLPAMAFEAASDKIEREFGILALLFWLALVPGP